MMTENEKMSKILREELGEREVWILRTIMKSEKLSSEYDAFQWYLAHRREGRLEILMNVLSQRDEQTKDRTCVSHKVRA